MFSHLDPHSACNHKKAFNPFGAAVDCSRLAGRARLATLVDANATALEIFSAAHYVNYKYSAPKGLRG